MMHEFISDEKLSREKNFNFISFLISAKPFGKGGACIHTHTYRFFFLFIKIVDYVKHTVSILDHHIKSFLFSFLNQLY